MPPDTPQASWNRDVIAGAKDVAVAHQHVKNPFRRRRLLRAQFKSECARRISGRDAGTTRGPSTASAGTVALGADSALSWTANGPFVAREMTQRPADPRRACSQAHESSPAPGPQRSVPACRRTRTRLRSAHSLACADGRPILPRGTIRRATRRPRATPAGPSPNFARTAGDTTNKGALIFPPRPSLCRQ